MASTVPVARFIKTAFYTSILIGVLAVAPLAYIKSVHVTWFSTGIHALLVFVIWLVNILLVFLSEKLIPGKYGIWGRYILSYVACIILIVLGRLLLRPFIPDNSRFTGHFLATIVVLVIALNTVVLIIQDLLLLQEKKARVELENAELRIKNIEATNQQLKQQVHPHFLFNSLNTLKTLIKRDPSKAEDYLIMLSDFLRASISPDTPGVAAIRNEIKLCIGYMEMQKIRFGEALKYRIDIPADVSDTKFIPVFSIQQLLENAIKHNAFTSEQPLEISITYNSGRITVENTLRTKQSAGGTGVGLSNLVDRYRILSGDEVIIKTSDRTFSVSISTFDDEHSDH